MPRILIADDDPLLRALLHHRLTADGHEVIALEDGGDVIEVVRTQLPDLVVLDAMMPVMDGFEILRRLHADPAARAVPVVMLTALRREEDIVSALQLGAVDYLSKPFIPSELSQRINRILETKAPSQVPNVPSRRRR
jgi:Response regulators consisting of a CheY-like receiver domain and a winged-helix DNA-binding domain